MQQSLNVLLNADDYEDKKMELEGLKNRLEANVSPHIVKAFTTSNFGNFFHQKFIILANSSLILKSRMSNYKKWMQYSISIF